MSESNSGQTQQPNQQTQPNQSQPSLQNPYLAAIVEIWKKTVDVQQHFNDLALRIRNYALALFTAIIGGVALLEKDKIQISVFHLHLAASFLLSIIGIFVLAGFWYMDKYWYHKLLIGAVKQAAFIEKKHSNDLPELSLGLSISEASPHKFFWKWKIHSKQKFTIFYGLLALPLLLLAICLAPWKQGSPNSSSQLNRITIVKSVDTITVRNKLPERNTTINHSDTSITLFDSSTHTNNLSP
jgi:hypothetical protein